MGNKWMLLVRIYGLTIVLFCCNNPSDFPVLKGPYLGQKPPGLSPEIFAPGIVSTEKYKEFGITFSPDGTEFYFTRGSIEFRENTIMVCREKDGYWIKPEIASFGGIYYDDEPHITSNGSQMFFGSERPRLNFKKGDQPYGLWMMKRVGDIWTESQYYGPGMYVTSASNGTIYYTVRLEKENWGIVKASFVNGKYNEPELLRGDMISLYFDGHPCIAPDESFLIFDSRRPGAAGGEGDIDLYICFRSEKGVWGEAINMGNTINSPKEGHVASLSPDGKYLFFATKGADDPSIFKGKSYSELMNLFKSYRNGYGTLYWVEAKFLKLLKPGGFN
jgi:hypothetical protein